MNNTPQCHPPSYSLLLQEPPEPARPQPQSPAPADPLQGQRHGRLAPHAVAQEDALGDAQVGQELLHIHAHRFVAHQRAVGAAAVVPGVQREHLPGQRYRVTPAPALPARDPSSGRRGLTLPLPPRTSALAAVWKLPRLPKSPWSITRGGRSPRPDTSVYATGTALRERGVARGAGVWSGGRGRGEGVAGPAVLPSAALLAGDCPVKGNHNTGRG